MDTQAFIQWALDDSRTNAERYSVELLCEQGLTCWNTKRRLGRHETFEDLLARRREQELNPAYRARYTEEDLLKAVEYLAVVKTWNFSGSRPVASFEALRFLTSLESVSTISSEATDLSPLAALPALRKLSIGSPGYDFGNPLCEDFSPLAGCASLRELVLGFNVHWPNLDGLDNLDQLETLTLSGNLLAMPRGASFPNVRRAVLHCIPLAARNAEDLPHLPACEILTLSGVERLDGIERMPALRNLTIRGPFRSFAPLEALKELTWLMVDCTDHRDPPKQPRDVTPVARLPKLLYFQMGPAVAYHDMPRDYSPLAEAPALRELVARSCPPVQMEVAAINAGLQPWDDLFLAPEPRPLPPLRMIVAPSGKHPHRGEEHRSPDERDPIDIGVRECEGRWVKNYAVQKISERIGTRDWGSMNVTAQSRSWYVGIESFDVVERLPEIIEAMREVFASLRHEYVATFHISLKVRPPEPTPAQKEFEKKLRDEQDDWEYEQRQRDRQEYLERLHQMELKQQQGLEIDPDEFSPSEREDYPEVPAKPADDEDDDDDEDGSIAVKTDPDPPQMYFDDEHPLAGNYRLLGFLSLEEVWIYPHHRGIACHLMTREPDLEIPEETEKT